MNSRRMISRREFLKYAALASSLAFGMSFAGCAGQPQKKKEVKVLTEICGTGSGRDKW